MKLLLLVFALLIPLRALSGEAQPVAKDPVLEQRMIGLAENLRCLVCQNESLASSPAELAHDLREEIRELMREGKSDQQIINYFTQRYGDFVLYKPPVKPLTWLLWFGPAVLLLAATGGLYFNLERRGRRIPDEPLSENEKTRIAALLASNGNES